MAGLDTGVIDIHGKQYNTVAKRVQQFHEDFSGTAVIKTWVMRNDENVVLVKAEIVSLTDGYVLAVAHAEEKRVTEDAWAGMDSSERRKNQVNYTNPLENAETSAVGRALAFLGYLTTDVATDEDLAKARQKAVEDELGEPDPGLLDKLADTAKLGSAALQKFFMEEMTKEQRQQVGPVRKDLFKAVAAEADKAIAALNDNDQ